MVPMLERQPSYRWSLFGTVTVLGLLGALIHGWGIRNPESGSVIWIVPPVFDWLGATSSGWFWAILICSTPAWLALGVFTGAVYESILSPSGSTDNAET